MASHTPSSPNPLGKNKSFSFKPLMPRRHLLSVMRQKVGKERSQEGAAPLAIPRCYPNLAETTLAKRPVGALRDLQEHPEGVLLGFSPPNLEPGLTEEKVRPCAHPPERQSRWAQRPRDAEHRDWFSPQARPHAFLRALPPRRDGRPTPPPAEGRNVRFAHLRLSAGVGLFPKIVSVRAPGRFMLFRQVRNS